MRDVIGQVVLTRLSDPRIDPARTSVTRVVVPEDLLTAKVYVSVIGTEAQQRSALRALSHAAGHIQELMMEQIQLRNTPILEFQIDTAFKKTLRTYQIIAEAMEEIRQKDQVRQNGPAAAEQTPGPQEPRR